MQTGPMKHGKNSEGIRVMCLLIILVVFMWFANVRSFNRGIKSTGLGSVQRDAILKQGNVDVRNMTLENLSDKTSAIGSTSESSPSTHISQLAMELKTQVGPSHGNKTTAEKMILRREHSIYKKGWDSDPIVIEEYKLLFFTIPKVGCTVFKQLFRRMMGYEDWYVQKDPWIPHQPGRNGLKYLNKYPLEKANHMMISPEWTRAIFLRDPKERVLSAYLDKVTIDTELRGGYIQRRCCKPRGWRKPNICDTVRLKKQKANETISVNGDDCSFQCFVEDIIPNCDDPHWRSSIQRIDEIFWPRMTFIGHFETLVDDTRRLLQQLGGGTESAWDKYGKSGWGKYGNESIFTSNSVTHATSAKQKLQKYYTPEVENMVKERYHADYESKFLNMTWKSCWD